MILAVTFNSLIPPKDEWFAPDAEPPPWFDVLVYDHGQFPPKADKKIVFHAVNKSGSLCLDRVIRDSFCRQGRKHEFCSHYHSGLTVERFVDVIRTSAPPRFFIGHQLFGRVPLGDPTFTIITQFRHPLPRLLSCYEWTRKRHIANGGTLESFCSFEQFVRRGAGKSHSQIIQFAAKSGEDSLAIRRSLTPRKLFERSLENIERYLYFAGIAEMFEETIFLVAHICGIQKVPPWKRDRRNVERPMAWTLAQETINLVHEVYRYDFELYDWAKRRLEQLLRKITLAGDFAAYQRKCNDQSNDRLLSTHQQAARLASAGQPTDQDSRAARTS